MRVPTRPAAAVALATASALAAFALPAAPALADSARDDSWHVKALELAEMHKVSQGEGVIVAVVDTGVDATHPDLKNNVLPGVDLYDDDAEGRVDRQGHGTGMASLIAGHGHGPGNRDGVLGIAPKAKILPVTIKNERSAVTPPTALAAGINWAVDAGADVVNVSLSSSFSEELNRAVERAYQSNVVVVAAAGNDNDILVGSPAAHPGCIAVNGIDRNGVISKKASVPGTPDLPVNIAAPGQDMVTAAPGGKYVTVTGSSTSSAVVSGAMALIKAKYPDLNAYELFQRLLETTREAGEPGHDQLYGSGVLDLRAALTGEPDGRGSRTAGPSAPAGDDALASARAIEGPGAEETVIVVLVWIAILAILVGTVLAVIKLRRRARQRRATIDTPDDAPETGLPTGASPHGSPAAPASRPPAPSDTDDTAWRRPPG
ncbi:type VII secretion-associated serine protease mycosin [Micromonospora sp. CA-263727]|uniref:type VII secretion-associated serine protease mycosin n=1 Tax=Micromonospora sp. CA-263727 TaxID=3239967 RepID=UPI003D8C7633